MTFGSPVGIGRGVRGRSCCDQPLGELRRAVRLFQQRSIQSCQKPRPDRAEGVGRDSDGRQLGRNGGEVIGVTTVGHAKPVDVGCIGDHAVMTSAETVWFH
jgi:hypothetical protein